MGLNKKIINKKNQKSKKKSINATIKNKHNV